MNMVEVVNTKVIKRDGTPQDYDFNKIKNAVAKAFNDVGQDVPEKFLQQLKESVEKLVIKNNGDGTPIEEIQDTIQKELIKRNKYDVVESFITYRKKREEIREQKSDLIKRIQTKLSGSNVVNQNANLDEASFGGRIGEAGRIVCKNEALKMMSKMSRKNHEQNMIYIHDLDSYAAGMHNCLSIPFDNLLANGFRTRQTDVRPAGSVSTAMQLVAVIFQLQSLQQFGGVSATHLDWTMVPYVRKSFAKHFKDGLKYCEGVNDITISNNISIDDDTYKAHICAYKYAIDMTERETHQAVEGMYHNLNTLQSRSGNQLPFTSINFGTCTLPEGRMIIKSLLEVSMEGLGSNGVTSIFPCGIFQIKSGINKEPGTPNYDMKRLAIESTTKRIYPNYANADWSQQQNWTALDRKQKQEYIDSLSEEEYNKLIYIIESNPELSKIIGIDKTVKTNKIIVVKEERPVEMFSTMGCRTANGHDIYAIDNFKENIAKILNGNNNIQYCSGSMKDGRGNICPVTIILPTLAMMSKQKAERNGTDIWKEFTLLLDKKIDEGTQMLIERFNHIASQSYKSAKFMYENDTMLGYKSKEGIVSALKHGTLALGQIGLSEALYILFGFDHTTEEGMKYAKDIEGLFNTKCSENKKKYHLNIGVYYTPAESLCGTSMKNFKKAYPEFDQENVTYYIKDNKRIEKTWFTNSIHVPVQYECDPFKKIDIESQLTGYSNAGCITYVEVGDASHNNINGIETLVDYAMDHDIPYFAINIKISQCHRCGERIWDLSMNRCPKCGCEEIDQLGRVTGYLSTTVKNFNIAKQDEFKNRTNHFKG